MRVTWITRSFLDYRIPVFKALSDLVQGDLTLLFSGEYVPDRVTAKARQVLGERAVPLSGEWKLGREDRAFMANRNLSLRWQPGLGRRVRQLHPDVIVTDGFFKWAFPCLLQRIFRGTPLVICYERTAHTERRAQGFRTLYRRWAVRRADAMCCNGRLCGEYTQSLGMPAGRITYGHMVADTEGMSEVRGQRSEVSRERIRSELRATGCLFLYVGRLVECKGLKEFLNEWAVFEREHAEAATLCLVGDGPLRADLEQQCRENGLHNVRFVGAVEYDDLAPYYAAADVFVMPTLEDNWSLVVPEAMACGLPILCSTYNGCWPELVHEGENGWIFDPLKKADTVRVLEQAVAVGSGLKAMGRKSRELVADHTPRKAAEAVLEACRIAIGWRGQ